MRQLPEMKSSALRNRICVSCRILLSASSTRVYFDSFYIFKFFPLLFFLGPCFNAADAGFFRYWIMDAKVVRTLVVGRHGNRWHWRWRFKLSAACVLGRPRELHLRLHLLGGERAALESIIRVQWVQPESRGRRGVRGFARVIISRKR